MATNQYQGNKYFNESSNSVEDNLTIEEALQITINGTPFSITMRTPGNDDELIRGLLYSEDVYRGVENLKINYSKAKDGIIAQANIQISENNLRSGYSNSRSFLSASSCGICGKTELQLPNNEAVTSNGVFNIAELYNMFKLMKKDQVTFLLSGGSHASSAFTENGKLLCSMEDVGRHNAVDKVIGYLVNNNLLKEAKCLTVSGRISYEIVSKVFAAKIPILAAVSAPSTLAVDFAKELGITLLGFCRENKATCYSHPERIVTSTK